jgi:threonine dehydrogenase-like Zn-dependent dehydrogenase
MASLRPDIVIEATGAPAIVFGALGCNAPYGIVCLTGVSSAGHRLTVDAGALNREIVLENDVVIGSVNANLGHYTTGAEALARADRDWLGRLITRRVPLSRAPEAFTATDTDVKVVITLGEAST